ncbi:MAG TPA: cupredoxin family copper-binding protein [Longimicrobiales bacterium]|nr:cupredoxin family copper-binding protein [Longimicrobiales bacterium]
MAPISGTGRGGWGRAARVLLLGVLVPVVSGSAAGAGGAKPKRHVVEMRGFEFRPAVVRVAVGDTVVWVNRDVVPHTATADGRGWDSANVAAGGSWTLVVRRKGAERYTCLYHPTMKGTLIVR